MKTWMPGAGQAFGLFLVGMAGLAAIALGLAMLARPDWTQTIPTPTAESREISRVAATFTPFLPLPTATAPPPTATATLVPTPEPTLPDWPPSGASLDGITGYPQSYALSCESRSAVDWARYFGVEISETEFLLRLPRSDNPEIGFVGDYNDFGGQIPPYSYGVHAGPVAGLLREYGLPASELKGLSLDDLRSEIASGRPVIVWVIYGLSPGYAIEYTASDGQQMPVAPNEHTVIVIGYDETFITVLDGAWIYPCRIDRFLRSWAVLENMAVVYRPEAE